LNNRTITYPDGEYSIDTGELVKSQGFVLREYQQDIVDKTRASIAAGHRRPLIVLGTGAGKSLVYAEIIKLATEKGKTCLFLVHRRSLVKQFAETVKTHCNINPSVIMAGEEFAGQSQVYVSTVQTYSRRILLDDKANNRFFIDADIILTDEAHTNVSPRWTNIFDEYQDKIIIGTTATPVRSEGRGLGEVFDDIINVMDVKKLTDQGYLAPVKYYEPAEIDLSKLKIRMGDYEVSGLEKKMNDPKLVGDVVQTWLKLGENCKTIVFSVNVKHSIALCDEFNKQGVPACQLDARSTEDEREAVFEKMENGLIKVICNVYLYVEGTDVPDIGCVVLARPTKSIGAFRQMVGRGLRISPGKKYLLCLDHGGVIAEHGYVDDEIEWTLDGKEKAWKKVEPKEKKKTEVVPKEK
jgi:superfamily II DNA or RNA helicase